MITVFIGLGSNLANPQAQIEQAISQLRMLPDSRLDAVASLYCSRPMGPANQPDYVNTVVQLATTLCADTLLSELQGIENEQGRERKGEHWGPRTLDLDILLYGSHTIQTERLTVPHYGMRTREFVLYPLYEIAPDLMLPDGTRLESLVTACPRNGLDVMS